MSSKMSPVIQKVVVNISYSLSSSAVNERQLDGLNGFIGILLWDDGESSFQCDQMSNLFFHYMAINNNKHWSKGIQNLPKYFQNCAKYQINLQNVAKLA